MNNYIWIYTDDIKKTKFIRKCYEYNINVLDIKELSDKTLFLIEQNDFNKLKKYSVYKYKIYSETGIEYLKNKIKERKHFLLAIIFGIVLIFFLSNVIVSVEIIHSKKEIRELLADELEEYGLKRLSLKKSFDKITEIKNNVLKNNKEKLEWLEIEKKGMKYIIHVEERILNNEKAKSTYCNIIAKRDGIIRSVRINKGVPLVKMGQSIKKDDILISGDIFLNEEIVSNVCAQGMVYGEVWYTLNIDMPLYYEKVSKTGKKRYNIMIEHNN